MDTQKKGTSGGRPGVMIYYDMVEPILSLRDADKGRLLMAIMEYGREGTQPKLTGKLEMAWGYIRPKLDRDAEAYENIRIQRRYAAFCRKRAGRRLPKIPMEHWLEMTEEERQQMLPEENEELRAVDADAARIPTGNRKGEGYGKGYGEGDGEGNGEGYGKGYGNGNTSFSAAAAAEKGYGQAAAAAERKLQKMNGVLGQGVVNLSEYQTDRLMEQLGVEMFDYYVKKLSDFILKNGASVKNHYGTILRWWQEDNGC